MITIENILSGNFEAYPEEVQKYMKVFSDKLREEITNELIKEKAHELLKEMKQGEESFILALSTLLENGFKGYKNMSLTTLLNIFLENKNHENFMEILEKVSSEKYDY